MDYKKLQFNEGFIKTHYTLLVVICIGVLVIMTGARFVNLDADPYPDYIPIDSGYHIDEGYKTFSVKNLLVFGDTSWHENDKYHGWLNSSPLTQLPYYFSFKNFGLELENARLVTAVYFSLFVVVALVFLKKRYGLLLSLSATLLLAADVALFHFSRSALFEIALVFFVYLGLLAISRVPNNKPLLALAACVTPTLIGIFTVKISAILYSMPAIMALSYVVVIGSVRSSARKLLCFALFGCVVLIAAFITRDTWQYRIPLDALLYVPKKLLLNPMPDLSVFALMLGYGCVLHLLLVKPKALYEDLYRLSLAVTVVFTPVILALFRYNPPRYYVVVIPACILLAVEWVHMQPWLIQKNISLTVKQKVLVALIFIPFSMLLLRAFNILVLENIPINIGDDPGISLPGLYKVFPIFLIGLSAVIFFKWSKSVAILGLLIPLFLLLHFVTGVFVQSNVLVNPSYDSQKIRSALVDIVTGTQSVAGDWAVFFTAEAPIRSFYMSHNINFPYPEHIANIRPDYFLDSDSSFDPKSLEMLELNESVSLSEPTQLGTYMGNNIQLYKLSYHY